MEERLNMLEAMLYEVKDENQRLSDMLSHYYDDLSTIRMMIENIKDRLSNLEDGDTN